MGEDAPGAVQIVPEGILPSNLGEHSELSEAEIASRIKSIKNNGGAWILGEGDYSRFSLAGQQSKFALARIRDRWFEPRGALPSTHIVKPGMQGSNSTNLDDQATEFVTMCAAKKIGINAADVDIVFFAD